MPLSQNYTPAIGPSGIRRQTPLTPALFLQLAHYRRWSCAISRTDRRHHAVLEANAKVNGRGPFSHPQPSETPQPISMSCEIHHYVPEESWRVKFGWNRFGRYGSAHAWKTRFCVDITRSHGSARVVRECCKGDNESQWERAKFDHPATQKTLNRWSPKFV